MPCVTPLYAVLLTLAQFSQWTEKSTLERRLHEIRSRSTLPGNSVRTLEQQCLALLGSESSPKDKGLVYSTVALVYADSGLFEEGHPAKAVEYCGLASRQPLDSVTAVKVYLCWGEALECAFEYGQRRSSPEEFQRVRREAAVLYLKGIKLALDNGAPVKDRTLPMVPMFNIDLIDEEAMRAIYRHHALLVRKREEAERRLELTLYYETFIAKCVDAYAREPHDVPELGRLARRTLKDEHAAAHLMETIRDMIGARLQQSSGWLPTPAR